jgi:hypothetical protein
MLAFFADLALEDGHHGIKKSKSTSVISALQGWQPPM